MEQRVMNKEAWSILLREEQQSITLSLGYSKSSWEAGEILKKAHYKYLEISARGEKFLRMFTEYFEEYGYFIPNGVEIPNSFKEYLSLVVLSRMTVRDAVTNMNDPEYKVTSFRDKVIDNILYKMQKSNIPAEKGLFDLIIEFDRWNNFRVLPRQWQQPSAFKRRNKTKDLKYLKNISSIHPLALHKVKELFLYGGRQDKLFMPVVAKDIPSKFEVVPVKDKAKTITSLTRMGFPLFEEKLDATEFAIMVKEYLFRVVTRDNSSVITGLKFWKRYRDMIEKAKNYSELENIIPNRKYQEDARIEEGIDNFRKLKRRHKK